MGSGFARKKKEAKLMQQQFSQIQEQMMNMEVSGSAGGGLVTITLSGDGEMKSIKIKPDCVDKDDIEGLELLVKTAYTDAQKKLKNSGVLFHAKENWSSLFDEIKKINKFVITFLDTELLDQEGKIVLNIGEVCDGEWFVNSYDKLRVNRDNFHVLIVN